MQGLGREPWHASRYGLARDTSPAPQLFGSSKPSTYSNAAPQDRYEVNLKLP